MIRPKELSLKLKVMGKASSGNNTSSASGSFPVWTGKLDHWGLQAETIPALEWNTSLTINPISLKATSNLVPPHNLNFNFDSKVLIPSAASFDFGKTDWPTAINTPRYSLVQRPQFCRLCLYLWSNLRWFRTNFPTTLWSDRNGPDNFLLLLTSPVQQKVWRRNAWSL